MHTQWLPVTGHVLGRPLTQPGCAQENKAKASGGAFFRTAGTGSITTSQFLGNTAVTDGGAIFDSQVGSSFAHSWPDG